MNNLPAGALYDANAPWNLPVRRRGVEECGDCCELFPKSEMHLYERYSWIHRQKEEVLLCEACVPRCGWKISAYDEPCREPAMSGSEGGWCAKHEREAELLEEQETGNSKQETGMREDVAA
jgi:hypothetical protein